MDRNRFCVNDKTLGSCWGTVVTFGLLEELILYEGCKMQFKQRLYEWNGKIYLWFKDMGKDPDGLTGDNYFIEVEE